MIEIYHLLVRLGLAANQCDFSRRFLGRSPRYYSYLQATGSNPPVEVLMALAMRLEWISQAAESVNETPWAAELLGVAGELREEVEKRSIATMPRPRNGKTRCQTNRSF